jgi:ATP-binding cassette, subfamily B, bacterial
MEAMERLMAGRTTLMIAHRRTTLDRCDIRRRVADGRVEDRLRPATGTPTERAI